jgi:prepilin-type N-terminal cleavage/methylation domain-containing protein
MRTHSVEKRAARGFTLIELMISMSLGMLLLAGAFQMHAAFNRQSIRQQELVDMQQSLRVASDVIAQALRNAGAGLNGGTLNAVPSSTCGIPNTYYPVEFGNGNTFADPRKPTDYDIAGFDVDVDPDWLRVVSLDTTATQAGQGVDLLTGNALQVADTTQFAVGSLFWVYNNVDPGPHLTCVRAVTGYSAALGATVGPNRGGLLHASANCANPAVDNCMTGVVASPTAPTYVFRGDRTMLFQIQTTSGGGPTTPRLMLSYTTPGQAPVWQTLTENIEDLQVVLILADGTECGRNGNSIDGPNPNTNACMTPVAVRYTLTARTSSPVPGFNLGQTGGFEDRSTTVTNDAYLRRSLTTEVQLRSMATP